MTDKEDPLPEIVQYAEALHKIHKTTGITQRALAKGVGTSPATVSRWLSGEDKRIATREQVEKILKFYTEQGFTIDESVLADLPRLREAAQMASGTVPKTADRLAEKKAGLETALKDARAATERARTALDGQRAEAEKAQHELLNKNRALGELLRREAERCQAEAERANRGEADARRLRRELVDTTKVLKAVQLAHAELLKETATLHELLHQKTAQCKEEAERADQAEADAADLRERLDHATKCTRDSEGKIIKYELDIAKQKKDLAALEQKVEVLEAWVAILYEEAPKASVADEATQVRGLVPVHVPYRPSDPAPPQPHRAGWSASGPDSADLLDTLANTPAPPERPAPAVVDRVLHYAVRLAAPAQIMGFCGALFHSAMTVGMLPGWSATAGLILTVTVLGILRFTYTWLKQRNHIAALISVGALICCLAMATSGHSFTLVSILAEIAEEEGTQWAEEFDRLPCNDGTSICPTWIRNN